MAFAFEGRIWQAFRRGGNNMRAAFRVLVAAFAGAILLAGRAAADDDGPYLGHCVDDQTVDAGRIVQACSLLLQDTYVTGVNSGYRYLLLLRRGLAEERMEKYAKAAADYMASTQQAPGYIDSWRALALLYSKAGQPDAVMDALDKMVQLQGANANILDVACWIRAGMNRQLDVAKADCEEALRLDPGDADTLDSRGLLHFRLGELSGAVADCTAALNANPRLATSFYIRGLAQAGLGRADLGTADIAKAKALFPGIAEWYARYGVTP